MDGATETQVVADKHCFAAAFADERPIEVDAPELGEGVVARFRPFFRVDDLAAVVATDHWREPLYLDMLLARLTLLDAEGGPVVDPGDDTWFQEGVDGVAIVRLSRRARLAERFVRAFRAAPDGDSEELTADTLRRTIADIALAMKLAPGAVRDWPLQDLRDVLASLGRHAQA